MIITKTTPYTKDEIKNLQEVFDTYIKTVIDIEKKVCSAGCDRHYESEEVLLKNGSNQPNIWGGGIDLETKDIDFNHSKTFGQTIKTIATKFKIRKEERNMRR